jgi:hypothetical protein
MNKNIHSNNQNELSLTIERPLNAKYYPLDDQELNGLGADSSLNNKTEKNPVIRLAMKVLSSIGFDL